MDLHRNRLLGYFTFENTPFLILTALLILIPIFFVSSSFMSFQFAKWLLVSLGTIAALISVLIMVIKKGSVSFSKSLILGSLAVLTVVYLLSSIFSSSAPASFIGYGFEIGTFFSIFLMAILTYAVSISFRDSKKLTIALVAFLGVAGLLALFQTSRLLFGVNFLSFGVFTNITYNTIGKWNELAIFFGVSGFLSLVTLEMIGPGLRKLYKILLYVLLVLSLCMVAIINFSTVWYVFGSLALLLFVYRSVTSGVFLGKLGVVKSAKTKTETNLKTVRTSISIKPIILVIVAIIFISPLGSDFSKSLIGKLGINDFEVRPSWVATHQIFNESIKDSPVFGAGPNRFGQQWQLFRPDINTSDFWDTDFEQGIGFVPTTAIETGILGTLAWAIFLLALLYAGIQALLWRSVDQITGYCIVSSLTASLFFWIMNILYTSSTTTLVLTFFFTGLFIASTVSADSKIERTIVFSRYQKISFAVIIVCVLALISSVGLAYVLVEKGRSAYFMQKAISVVSLGNDIEGGRNLILQAIHLSGDDTHYRTLAELDVAKINDLISRISNKSAPTEVEKTELQNTVAEAIESARLAEKRDPGNFKNHVSSAKVYESLLLVGVTGSYEAAQNAYAEAVKLSPRNPYLYLALAKLEGANKNLDKAREYLAQSLILKPNYVDAYFLQSQLDIAKGDMISAIKNIETTTLLTPSDPLAFFRLGLLKYQGEDWAGGIAAFERALALQPIYANAEYFLGLSYAKVGRWAEAVSLFEDLKNSNPENQEVKTILKNLQAGKDPFAEVSALESQ